MRRLRLHFNRLLIVLLITLSSTVGWAATYYVDGSASNDSGSGTAISPKKYIKSGIGLMSSGDTLVISNGTYSGTNNCISSADGNPYTGIPSGTGGAYTTIQAETDFGVVIDGQSTYHPVYIENASYIKFQGLHVKNGQNGNGSRTFSVRYSNHIKVIKCASEESYGGHFVADNSSYCLFEDCFAWGMGTYYFWAGGQYDDYTTAQYNVFRRCVVRRDIHYYTTGGNHYSSFVTYRADNNYFQNCIDINANSAEAGITDPNRTMAVFYTANGSSDYHANGCVSIGSAGKIGQFESTATPVVLENISVLLSKTEGEDGIYFSTNTNTSANLSLFGYSLSSGSYSGIFWGNYGNTSNSILVQSNSAYKDCNAGTHTYNVLHGNAANCVSSASCPGVTEFTTQNPYTSGLLYPVRVESGSWLDSGHGSSGGKVGPTILTRIGTDGTLYGDTGWNTDTGVALWPFPNEAIIKTKMSTYNLHSVTGARGFCTGNSMDGSEQTLTKYIWEYLGNQIPADIYGTTSYPTLRGGIIGRIQ